MVMMDGVESLTDIRVIDDYFPQWMVKDVGEWVTDYCPLYYNNAPYGDYKQSRFMGNTVIRDNAFTDTSPWYWFFAYLNECIIKDICKDTPISHIHRVLVNGQSPDMVSEMHTDHDRKATSVVYHAFGDSGDTIFETGERVEFKQGRLIVFDSSIKHMGTPPASGFRVTLGVIAPWDVTPQEPPTIYPMFP